MKLVYVSNVPSRNRTHTKKLYETIIEFQKSGKQFAEISDSDDFAPNTIRYAANKIDPKISVMKRGDKYYLAYKEGKE